MVRLWTVLCEHRADSRRSDPCQLKQAGHACSLVSKAWMCCGYTLLYGEIEVLLDTPPQADGSPPNVDDAKRLRAAETLALQDS